MRVRPTPDPAAAGGDTSAADSSAETGTTPDAAPAAETGAAEHPSGDNGKPKRLHVAGLGGEFGPVEIPGAVDDDGKQLSYTITTAGTVVAGPHVQAVRDAAAYAHVPLRTTAAPTD